LLGGSSVPGGGVFHQLLGVRNARVFSAGMGSRYFEWLLAPERGFGPELVRRFRGFFSAVTISSGAGIQDAGLLNLSLRALQYCHFYIHMKTTIELPDAIWGARRWLRRGAAPR
jgi:hypothetical protein